MLLSVKITEHTLSFVQASSPFVGSGMANDYQVTVGKNRKSFDFRANTPSCDFSIHKNERVKEIKCVFV